MDELTPMQARFVDEYMIDLNATQACLRAGYSKKNPDNADKIGPELLGHPRVSAEIEKRKIKLSKKAEVTTEWVIKELRKQYKRYEKMPKLPHGMKALELLGKHTGAFMDRVQHSGDPLNPIQHKMNVSVDTINDHIGSLLSK